MKTITEEQVDMLLAKGWQISGDPVMLHPPIDNPKINWAAEWRLMEYKGEQIEWPHMRCGS